MSGVGQVSSIKRWVGWRLDTASIQANMALPSALGRGRWAKKSLLIHTQGLLLDLLAAGGGPLVPAIRTLKEKLGGPSDSCSQLLCFQGILCLSAQVAPACVSCHPPSHEHTCQPLHSTLLRSPRYHCPLLTPASLRPPDPLPISNVRLEEMLPPNNTAHWPGYEGFLPVCPQNT